VKLKREKLTREKICETRREKQKSRKKEKLSRGRRNQSMQRTSGGRN
jgi:hypothetical protein